MGIPGVLVGPVIVAFFLALYTIYLEDYLGIQSEEPEKETSSWTAYIDWFRTKFMGKGVNASDPSSPLKEPNTDATDEVDAEDDGADEETAEEAS